MKIESALFLAREVLEERKILLYQGNYVQTLPLFGENVPTISTHVPHNPNQTSKNIPSPAPFLEKYPLVLHFLSLARIMPSGLNDVNVLASLGGNGVFFTLIPSFNEYTHPGAVRGRFRLTPQVHKSGTNEGRIAVSVFDRIEDIAKLVSDGGPHAPSIQALESFGNRRAADLAQELFSITINPFGLKEGARWLQSKPPVQPANLSSLS